MNLKLFNLEFLPHSRLRWQESSMLIRLKRREIFVRFCSWRHASCIQHNDFKLGSLEI